MNRTEIYKNIAFENGKNQEWTPWECRYITYSFVPDLDLSLPVSTKRALLEERLMDKITLEINDSELFIGRLANSFEMDDEKHKIVADGWKYECSLGDACGWRTAKTDHRVLDYERVLNFGIKSVLAEIDGYLAKPGEDDEEKRAFYEASKISLTALCRLGMRCRTFLISAAEQEKDKTRKAELLKMAGNFEKAPYEPCTHFYEALQCVWLMEFCCKIIGDISVTGRADNYFYPFYKRDIESGYITDEFAMELIEQFYFKHTEIYNNWSPALMVGGVDREGKPVWNELTRMFIKAIDTTGLVAPAVSIAWTEDMPEDIVELSLEVLAKGYTRPALFNDRIVQKGLLDAGATAEDARDYLHSCCVEITPCGASDIMVATPYVNICRAVDYVLCEKTQPYKIGTTIPDIDVGWGGFGKYHYISEDVDFNLDDLDTFEKFYDVMKKVISKTVEAHALAAYEFDERRSRYKRAPLSSALIRDCLKNGKDCSQGGARYNYIYPCFTGAINLIDSIAAVRKAVYEDKVITLRELGKACENNLEDVRLRNYLIEKCPKFGNNLPEVDEIGQDIYEFLYNELQRLSIDGRRKFYPSYFAWKTHGIMGSDTMATPDGRRYGEALSEHLGSASGRDKNGPIGVMKSLANLDQSKGIGGIATNYKFSKAFMAKKECRQALAAFIKEFMKNDCFEMQFNVTTAEDLLKAKENPEDYQTLMVRVAGFSDYFVRLGDNIQDEIIRRTETGSM